MDCSIPDPIRGATPDPLPEEIRAEAEAVLRSYPLAAPHDLCPLGNGLMHRTLSLRDRTGDFVLQQVHPLFSHAIHENIRAVTRQLAAEGVPTPELVPTTAGELYHQDEQGRAWRLLTRLPGETLDRCPSPTHAESASHLIARVHTALGSLEHTYRPLGLRLHDTEGHLQDLRSALERHGDHPLIGPAREFAARIFEISSGWSCFTTLPKRAAHGDLKFNNILFQVGASRAHALIDLDTFGPLPLFAELGDAWRSWCNRSPDDYGSAELDLEIWRASAGSYLDACTLPLTAEELASLAQATERISLELAARFTADMLEESYFGWDATRYARAGEHHRMRARTQLDLHDQAQKARSEFARFLGC